MSKRKTTSKSPSKGPAVYDVIKSATTGRFATVARDTPSVPHADARELKALYVMLEQEQLDRYKRLAELAGMTMRDYVTRALETYAAGQLADDDAVVAMLNASEHDDAMTVRRLNNHSLRLDDVEKRLTALQRRVDQQWGPDAEWELAKQQAEDLEK